MDRVKGREITVSEFSGDESEPLRKKVGQWSAPGHAMAESGVVEIPSMVLPHSGKDRPGGIGNMVIEPFVENLFQFERKPQENISGSDRSYLSGLYQKRLEFMVCEEGNDRGGQDSDRDSRRVKRTDHFEAPIRGCSPWFKRPREFFLQRSDRDEDMDQIPGRHGSKYVNISLDDSRFCDNRYRMVTHVQNFKNLAGDLESLFGGLIGVCIDSQGNGLDPIPFP